MTWFVPVTKEAFSLHMKRITSTSSCVSPARPSAVGIPLIAARVRTGPGVTQSAIQELCGFKNANALKNLFKSRYGVSIRDWRAQNSQK